jgi:hypothetical protein
VTEDRHLDQARHNLQLLRLLNLTDYPDWGATLVFYAAVHQVEAALARTGFPDSRNHADRHRQLKHLVREKRLAANAEAAYQRLYLRSRWARYEDWQALGLDAAMVNKLERLELTALTQAVQSLR